MKIDIKINDTKKQLGEFRDAKKNVKAARQDVDAVLRQLKSNSEAQAKVSNVLVKQSESLDQLITKLATMENGLEQAVAIYLQYEKEISGQRFQHGTSIEGFETMRDKISAWWEDVKDWIETGVWNDKEKADQIRRDKAMAKELKNLLKSDRYSKKTWKKASLEERKQILKDLFQEMNRIYGISVDKIYIESIEAPEGYITYGYYNNGRNIIAINEDVVSDSSKYDMIMDTMAHEMRHAYQWSVVQNPENYDVNDATVEAWRENYRDYKTMEEDGFEAYQDQPIEKDARQFAGWVI